MKKKLLFIVGIAVILCGCGHRTSSADLQHKLDSVRQLEERIRLEAQGIHLGASDPISLFLDSLEVMTLPIEGSSEESVVNSSFRDVPDEAFVLMHILRPGKMKAVLLPDLGKIRMMLMAGDDDVNGGSVTYLYTFDMGYHVVDSLWCSGSESPSAGNEEFSQFRDDEQLSDYPFQIRVYDGGECSSVVGHATVPD